MDFIDADLRGSKFEDVDLTGAQLRAVHMTNAQFRGVDLTGALMRGVDLVNVDISGDVKNLTINGVDVAPLIEAELDRRYPLRPKMRPTDPAGFREACVQHVRFFSFGRRIVERSFYSWVAQRIAVSACLTFPPSFSRIASRIRFIFNIAFRGIHAHNQYRKYILSVSRMGHYLERAFLYPGNKVCDACHVRADDDRAMIRTLVNMVVWNLVVLLVVLAIY